MLVLELFGGIGACCKALDRLKIDYEIADYVEIDKFAVKSFNALHCTTFEPNDIRNWNKDVKVDLIMHGSPCQDFSLSGKQNGGDEGSGTRSSLMYETLRIVEKTMPKYVIWENVRNILSKKHKHNFTNYLNRMFVLGFRNYYSILNAKDFGIPQNRERVFVISIRNDIDNGFSFPQKQTLTKRIKDFCEDNVDAKYYLNKDSLSLSRRTGDVNDRIIVVGNYMKSRHEASRIVDAEGIAPTIKENHGTVTAILLNNQIRKLTPKEFWLLMGFDNDDYEKVEKISSVSQLYKQAGNSIVVNVLEAIFKQLFNFS